MKSDFTEEEMEEILELCPTSQLSWMEIYRHVEGIANREQLKHRPGPCYNENSRTLRFLAAVGMLQVLDRYPQKKELDARLAARAEKRARQKEEERKLEQEREAEKERVREEIRKAYGQ